MKIYVFNGSPRKNRNTAQMLNAVVDGIKASNPDADVEYVNLFDYTYKGCISCFSCQRKENRNRLRCQVKDCLYEMLDGAFHADGLVFGSPIYFFDITAQMRAFLERLMYPGDSDKVIPTTFVYTMNANEEQKEMFNFEGALSTSKRFLESTFRQAPECVYSFNTYQYCDSDAFHDGFRNYGANEEKKQRNKVQFPIDLQNAYNAGVNLVNRIRAAQSEE